MTILLVYPRPTQESPQRTPPLSILYPGAYVSRRGYRVEYFDERWDTDFRAKLDRADIVGVSSMSGFQLGRALEYLKEAHEAGKTTIMGGVYCTLSPQTCIGEPYIDYVVVGEGEETLADLLENIRMPEGVRGIWTKTDQHPEGFYTGARPALDPDRIESPLDEQALRYFRLAAESNDVMLPASRGCANKCGFCYNSAKPDGGEWRPIPLENWTRDLDYLLEHGIKIPFLQIGDDWLGNKARIFSIGEALADRGIDWHLSIRANQVDEELASRLKSMRCVGVSIGAESGSDEILKLMNKRINVGHILRASEILAKHGIKPLYYFILGTPTETCEQMAATMDLADRLYIIHQGNCSMAFFGFDPLIGTPLYALAESVGQPVPKTLVECGDRERCNTHDPIVNAIYYIAGLTFHRTKGDKTDRNFPGARRLLILPFELLCVLRWKLRFFRVFTLERWAIKRLLAGASCQSPG